MEIDIRVVSFAGTSITNKANRANLKTEDSLFTGKNNFEHRSATPLFSEYETKMQKVFKCKIVKGVFFRNIPCLKKLSKSV